MNSRKSKAIFFMGTLIFVFAFISICGLRIWSKSFELIDYESSLNDTISYSLNNHGALHVWGEKGKYLIPPTKAKSRNSERLILMVRKGGRLIKESNSSVLTLEKDSFKFEFELY